MKKMGSGFSWMSGWVDGCVRLITIS